MSRQNIHQNISRQDTDDTSFASFTQEIDMPFSVSWHTLLDHAEDLPEDATLVAPISHAEFQITDTQEHRLTSSAA
jgi:GMP synthase-like glutamine amidotransferase